MRRFIVVFIVVLMLYPAVPAFAEQAQECSVEITVTNGKSAGVLQDDSYTTQLLVTAGESITLVSEVPFYSLYIEWNCPVSEWELEVNGSRISCGENGFLHEYVPIEEGTLEAVLHIDSDMAVSGIRAYSDGELPDDVQCWQPPCEKADILLYSSHADDEILFFGGIIPTYAGERGLAVQVAYFSQYWNGDKRREHEKLDGLWTAGVRNYPVDLGYEDLYSENFEQAVTVYDYDEALEKTVELVRRFQPQVAVAQDFDGEYGHGTHMLTARLLADAVEISMDSEKFAESAEVYGCFDVPKTYFHLYPENRITLDCRVPLEAFGGKRCLEVAKEAYLKHVSQQWCWFHVSDTSIYSCGEFGLYRTTVGLDTQNDLMENLTSYEEQRRIKEEEEARIAEALEKEQAQQRQKQRTLFFHTLNWFIRTFFE